MADKITFGQKLLLGWGKARRFYLHVFRRGYVERSIARRTGECTRCGACCKLMFVCPHLDETNNPTECKTHDTRAGNCRFFPIDERDLRDRNIVMPDQPCGFSFPPSGGLVLSAPSLSSEPTPKIRETKSAKAAKDCP